MVYGTWDVTSVIESVSPQPLRRWFSCPLIASSFSDEIVLNSTVNKRATQSRMSLFRLCLTSSHLHPSQLPPTAQAALPSCCGGFPRHSQHLSSSQTFQPAQCIHLSHLQYFFLGVGVGVGGPQSVLATKVSNIKHKGHFLTRTVRIPICFAASIFLMLSSNNTWKVFEARQSVTSTPWHDCIYIQLCANEHKVAFGEQVAAYSCVWIDGGDLEGLQHCLSWWLAQDWWFR